MSAGLRSRRGYTAPTDDGDDSPAAVLDPQGPLHLLLLLDPHFSLPVLSLDSRFLPCAQNKQILWRSSRQRRSRALRCTSNSFLLSRRPSSCASSPYPPSPSLPCADLYFHRLILLKSRSPFLPFLGALVLQLSLAASSARLFLSSSAAPAQIDLFPLVPSLLISLYMLSQAGDAVERLLWGVAVVGVQGMGLMVQWDAARAVKDAEELRRLMYSAPEA